VGNYDHKWCDGINSDDQQRFHKFLPLVLGRNFDGDSGNSQPRKGPVIAEIVGRIFPTFVVGTYNH